MSIYSTREHSNPEYTGFCCPHCLESNDYTTTSDTSADPNEVTCTSCDKNFAIWNETETLNVSGLIEYD